MRRHTSRAVAVFLVILTLICSCQTYSLAEDAFTVLLIGLDTYSPDANGRSDTMMLARLSPGTGRVKLLSFLRDLYVSVPGHGHTRLNAAYYYGGAELLKQTLYDSFGVSVDRVVRVDFSQMVDIVDELGGVEITLNESERKQLNSILRSYNEEISMPKKDGLLDESGTQLLSGKQALSFSRIRKMDSDFQRTNRQRQVLEAMLIRLKQLDLFTLAKLAVINLRKIETDLTISDLYDLLPIIADVGQLSLESAHVPFDGVYTNETINGMQVLVPNLNRNRKMISEYLSE